MRILLPLRNEVGEGRGEGEFSFQRFMGREKSEIRQQYQDASGAVVSVA